MLLKELIFEKLTKKYQKVGKDPNFKVTSKEKNMVI